ncbi:MAG TPA: putative DNA-binding domain-containing protein [Polyangiaceae bacterium]|nr:putative DNA-binding domain-containing protein [Polyangiaceae bacterium]
MTLRDYQQSMRSVLLDREVTRESWQALGGDVKRWQAYRRMVRSRFYQTIDHGFERLASALGEERFHQLVDAFLATEPPRSPYLRDLPREFLRFFEARWPSLRGEITLPPYALDLARYEWAELETAYSFEEVRAAEVGPLAMDAVAVLSPAHRLLELSYAVHTLGVAGDDAVAERPTWLCLYRDPASHEVTTLDVTKVAWRMLVDIGRAEIPLTDIVRDAAKGEGVEVDVAFVEALSTLLADLVERGVILGSFAKRKTA